MDIAELHKSTVHIENLDNVNTKLRELISGGASKLQILSDFDNTITRVHLNGVACQTTYGILDSSPMISEEARLKARTLKEKYVPIETDPFLTIEEKIPFMEEWYAQSQALLTTSGINKSDFESMVKMSKAMLRDDARKLFEMLDMFTIPVLILSAGLGDLVEETLKYYDTFFPNIKCISNYMTYDEAGMINGFKGDLIHTFNKNHKSLQNGDYFEVHKSRNNVILLGDSLGDLNMVDGIEDLNAILKIGFLNSNIDDNLTNYMRNYDIVLTDDQTMDIPFGITKKILHLY